MSQLVELTENIKIGELEVINDLASKSKTIETDPEGYLLNLDQWDQQVAEAIAEQEGISLSENHWEIIHFIRDFYQTYDTTPAVRALVKRSKKIRFGKRQLQLPVQIILEGPAKQASKLAGLPKPARCL